MRWVFLIQIWVGCWYTIVSGSQLSYTPISRRCYSARKIYYQKDSWLSTSKWKILSLVLPPPQRRGLRDKFLPGNRLNGNHTLRKNRRSLNCGGQRSIVLFAILAGGLGLFAALDAGALVMLTLTHLSQHTGLGAAALKAFQSALQRLVFSHTDFRHLYFPPSGAAGRPSLA